MTWFSAIVLYAVVWFLTLFMVLPFRMVTQGESGEVMRGTHASAPANPQMKKRLVITTLIATTIWALAVAAIVTGWIAVLDFDARWGYGS